MPIFARPELHERDQQKPDYRVLTANMARWQFSHTIYENGCMKQLPTGLYVRTAPCPLDLAKDMVQYAADLTGFANCGVVYSEEGFLTFGLRTPILGASVPGPLRQSVQRAILGSPLDQFARVAPLR